jgi:protein-S-isoprenylcysteine O-methyltransferase Ste14
MTGPQIINLLKSILHNVGVVLVGFVVAIFGKVVDALVGIPSVSSAYAIAAGSLLLVLGFLLRVWATFYFYERRMKVIRLEPQQALITTGPYRFSRNPLYLGGNVFIFFGAALVFGSPVALAISALQLVSVDRFIRREEKQLEAQFGEEWERYRYQVRRWI